MNSLRLRCGAALMSAVLLAVVAGCASSGAGSDTPIPENAIEVRLYSDDEPDDYYTTIKRRLEMWGFEMSNHSQVRRSFVTHSSDVGRRVELVIRLVSVELDSNLSSTVAVFYGSTDHGTAQWKSSGGDESFAFKKMVDLLETIPNKRLEFGTSE